MLNDIFEASNAYKEILETSLNNARKLLDKQNSLIFNRIKVLFLVKYKLGAHGPSFSFMTTLLINKSWLFLQYTTMTHHNMGIGRLIISIDYISFEFFPTKNHLGSNSGKSIGKVKNSRYYQRNYSLIRMKASLDIRQRHLSTKNLNSLII